MRAHGTLSDGIICVGWLALREPMPQAQACGITGLASVQRVTEVRSAVRLVGPTPSVAMRLNRAGYKARSSRNHQDDVSGAYCLGGEQGY